MLDILMITHNRLEYLKKAFPSVMAQEYVDFRLKIWDNGSDQETVRWLKAIEGTPNVSIHFNPTNDSLSSVTNKVFLESTAEFVGKVDSDTLVPFDWANRLIGAHQAYHFGFIGGFHFRKEDLKDIKPIISDYNGIKIWKKHHIGGCAFVIRREDFGGYEGAGMMGLSEYQAELGLVNGYIWDPILWVEHMEDGRSEHFIGTKEYADYKRKTRNISLAQYTHGAVNMTYLKENTHND